MGKNDPDYKTNDPKGWCGDPKRGAALGRPTISEPDGNTFRAPLTLREVKLDSGGYDCNGTYFGIGAPLYWCASRDGKIDRVFRATGRAEAEARVTKMYPKAKFKKVSKKVL